MHGVEIRERADGNAASTEEPFCVCRKDHRRSAARAKTRPCTRDTEGGGQNNVCMHHMSNMLMESSVCLCLRVDCSMMPQRGGVRENVHWELMRRGVSREGLSLSPGEGGD